jgi:hypothetical protein
MDRLAQIDPILGLALAMGFILLLCLVILLGMRDRAWAPPRLVSRSVRCPTHGRLAAVQFTESMRTGLVLRSVHSCSLLAPGERCDEACCSLPARP